MEYKLINPSDPYTFIADNLEVSAIVVLILGVAYGAEPKDGGEMVPVFIFGGAMDWYKEKFGRTPTEGLKARKKDVADALDSFMLGSFKDRRRYEAALSAITAPDKRAEFISAWQDGRSSMNNIGGLAHTLAKTLRNESMAGRARNRLQQLNLIRSEML